MQIKLNNRPTIWSVFLEATIKLLMLMVLLGLSGCASLLFGEKGLQRNPIETPVVNITNFSHSLQCMDEMLLDYDVAPILITAQDIPNLTAQRDSEVGSKDMLITSLSRISERSGKVRFISYGSDLGDILLIHKTHKESDRFVAPDFFIRGAVTQLDKNVIRSRVTGLGGLFPFGLGGLFSQEQISYISLDLNIGLISNLQMLPGITSNNVLAITDKGVNAGFGGRIEKVGSYFDFGLTHRDGIQQAVRNMVDLGVIEVVGKLSDVPYLSCLPVDVSQPQVVENIRKEYEVYKQKGMLVKIIQGKLKQNREYQGAVDGILNQQTFDALSQFTSLSNSGPSLIDSGQTTIDFDVYKRVVYGKAYQVSNYEFLDQANVKSYDIDSLIANKQVNKKEDTYKGIAQVNKNTLQKTSPSVVGIGVEAKKPEALTVMPRVERNNLSSLDKILLDSSVGNYKAQKSLSISEDVQLEAEKQVEKISVKPLQKEKVEMEEKLIPAENKTGLFSGNQESTKQVIVPAAHPWSSLGIKSIELEELN